MRDVANYQHIFPKSHRLSTRNPFTFSLTLVEKRGKVSQGGGRYEENSGG